MTPKTMYRYLEKHKNVNALALFIILVGIFFFKTLLFGKLPVPSDTLVGLYHPWRDLYVRQYPNGIPFKNFLITDPIRQQIPWRKTVIDSLQQWKLPRWNPYSFSGTPLLANIQSGALYPFNILFLFFSFEIAWTMIIVSQPLFAGIFLFLFLRNKRLLIIPSFVGAVIFAFSGFSVAWFTWGTMVSTFMWVPLMLYLVDKIHSEKKKLRWKALFIVSVVFSYFAGNIQIFLYGIAVVLWYSYWTYWRKGLCRLNMWHVYAAILCLLLICSQFIPFIKFILQTQRISSGADWTHEGFFIPLHHLIQFIAPDFFGNPTTLNYWGTWNYAEMVGYIGISGLFLAILGISGQTIFWFLTVIIALVFSVASPISMLPYRLHIPIISLLQPTRLLSVIDLALSVLAAYGLSEFVKGRRKISGTIIVVFVGIVCCLWIWVYAGGFGGQTDIAVARHNLVMPSFFLIAVGICVIIRLILPKKIIRYYWTTVPVVIIALCIFDLFRFGWKFIPFTDRTYFFPQTKIISFLQTQKKPFRMLATDDRILPPNVNEFYGIESISGYDPLHDGRYEEFIAAAERGSSDIRPPYGYERIMTPKNYTSPLIRLLNVRFILSFDAIQGAREVMAERKTKLFEMSNIVPRVYLADTIITKTGKQEIIDILTSSTFIPGSTVVVETKIPVLSVPLTTQESVSIQSYEDDMIQIRVIAGSPRLLVIGNIFDPGWKALVDGKPVSIYRTNYLFMGIIVPTGDHTASLVYR